MSHYLDLTPEERIKLARDAVKARVPIAPVIASWLHAEGLYDRVTNPKASNDPTNASDPATG